MNRNGTLTDHLTLTIFDDTASATLTLYHSLCDSAPVLTPSHTILFISNPGWRIERTAKLSLTANTRIDIDPDVADARRLRSLATRLTKREHVNPAFPCVAVDVDSYEHALVHTLFHLADIDACARANPAEQIVGYVSVILVRLEIVTPYKRNMLMCNECCGVAVFANALQAECKGCGGKVGLRINPRIVRILTVSEVGCRMTC
jgi:hypothetical protein